MTTINGVEATHANAHSDMGRKGLFQAIINCQATIPTINGEMTTFVATHSTMTRKGGAETVRLAGTTVTENGIDRTYPTMSQHGMNNRGKARTNADGTTNPLMVFELVGSTTFEPRATILECETEYHLSANERGSYTRCCYPDCKELNV